MRTDNVIRSFPGTAAQPVAAAISRRIRAAVAEMPTRLPVAGPNPPRGLPADF